MKISAKYLLIFIALFFVIDLLYGLILDNVFPRITFGTYGKVNTSLDAKKDLLIFGSSRSMHHYDPDIISQKTNLSSYNTGLGGYGLFYNYALLNEIINNNKPRIAILDLSPNVIVDPKTYIKLNVFMPYYFNYLSFNEIIRLDPDYSRFKTLFKTYNYNSTLYDFVRSFIETEKQNNGYKGLHSELDATTFTPIHLSNSEIFDSTKEVYLNKLIDIAKSHEIRLLCIVSPTYEKFDTKNRIIGEMQKIIEAKGVEFYDYSDYNLLYGKPEYFKDQLHLNVEGVKIFNKIIADKINQSTYE